MNKNEVLKNLREVCRVYKGTLDDHQYLQEALRWLAEQLESKNEQVL